MSVAQEADAVMDVDDKDSDTASESDEDETTGISFVPAETLPEIHWHRRTIYDLYEMMNTPYLVLNPDYQRDVVWTSERMTKLINSLMSGYYVPPLIFNVHKKDTDDGPRYIRISVDGKQRLTSIREFMSGHIPCTDKRGCRWFMVDDGNAATQVKKRILPAKTQQRFVSLNILCAEYMGLERKQEEDLFSRVQLGMPLTPAEKLKASSGEWQSFAIDLEKLYPDLLDVVDNRRARGFQLILQILKQIVNAKDFNPKYSAGAGSLKGFCDRPQLLDEAIRRTARRVFATFSEIQQKHPNTFENHNYKHSTKFSPIEFVGVGVLIHQFPDRNAGMLAGDILLMRQILREVRQDLRSNTQTWKAVVGFIENIEQYRGGASVVPLGASGRQDVSVAPSNMPSQQKEVASRPPAESPLFLSNLDSRPVQVSLAVTTAPAPAPAPALALAPAPVPARPNSSTLGNLSANSLGGRLRNVPEDSGSSPTKRKLDGQETPGMKRERLD